MKGNFDRYSSPNKSFKDTFFVYKKQIKERRSFISNTSLI